MGELRYGGEDPPRVTSLERAKVLEGHERMEVGEFRSGNGIVIEAKLLVPVCAKCGEEWGEQGCPTVRAMAALAWHERVGQRWRIRERTLEALSAREYVGLELSASGREVTFTVVVDAEAVRVGGVELVAAALDEMRRRVAVELFKDQVGGRLAVFR